VLADSAYGDNSEFRRRVRCEGLGYAVGLHRTTTVWRLDLLGRRIGDPVAVGDLADDHRARWLSAGDLARRNEGKMSSRFATERVVLAQDDLVESLAAERSGFYGMAAWREAATDFTATNVAGEHVTAQLVRRVKQRWRTERVYEEPRESLGWITTRAAPSAAGTTMCPWCWFDFAFIVAERSRGFSPLGRKNCHAESVASSRRCGRQPARSGTSGIPSSLCAWPSRASWPHGYPDAPCVTDRDRWDRLVHMPVNTDGRLPF